MYTVNIAFKHTSNIVTFVFKNYKDADDLFKVARKVINTDYLLDEEDDYNLKSVIDMLSVASVTFSDFEKDMDKGCEMALIQTKSQLKAQNLAKSDVGLQMLGRVANSSFTQ